MYAVYKGWSGACIICLLAVLPLCCMLLTACSTNSSHALNSSIRQVQIREDDFHIRSSSTVFAHDVPYHFVIKNDGHMPHEFMITPLTLSTMNGMSVSDMDQLELWLRGARWGGTGASALGSGVRTLMLRMLGGERQHYTGRSATFRAPG